MRSMKHALWLLLPATAACGSSANETATGIESWGTSEIAPAKKKPICTVDSDPDTCSGSGSHACGEEQTSCPYACLTGLTYNAGRSVCVPCGAPGLLSCGGTCNPGLVSAGARCMRPDAKQAPTLAIMCKYNETTDTGVAEGATRQLLLASGSGKDNLFDYYAEMTYGRLDLSGSQVAGWYSMGSVTDPSIDPTKVGRVALNDACVAAAQKANPSLALGSYFRVISVISADYADDGSGGGATVTIAQDHLDTNFMAHEIGHSYGLQHTQDELLSSCGGAPGDYCDAWDEMSAQLNYAHAAPGMRDRDGAPGANGFVAGERLLLGANLGIDLFGAELVTAPVGTSTMTLAAVNRPDVAGVRVVKIPNGASGYYTVELIRNTGWDIGAPATRVLVHLVDAANRVKIVLSGAPDKALAAAMSVTRGGVTVTVVSINEAASTAVVTVTRAS